MQEDPTLFIRTSFRVLARNFYKLLGISILVATLGYGIAKQFPATYEVNFSYMVSMEQRDESSNFRYDGYYALSATDLFSATLAGVIVSPETIVAAYGGANIPLPTEDTIDLVKSIRSEKVAPQLVRVRVRNASRERAEDISSGLMDAVEGSVDQYNQKGNTAIVFRAIATTPWTSTQRPDPLPIAISLFMLVWVGGNFLILLKEAIDRGPS